MKFVILSTQRSGSIFLFKSLNVNPAISCVGEVLKPDGQIFGKEYSYYRGTGLHFNKVLGFNTLLFYKRVLRKIDTMNSQAKGFKLMIGQDKYFFGLEYLFRFNGVKIIRLYRPNVLKQHVSRLRARKDKTWVAKSSEYQKSIVDIEIDGLISELETLESIQIKIRKKFKSCESMDIKYPDLINNFEGSLNSIEEFLTLEPFLNYETTRNVKIGGRSIDHDVNNWKDVCTLLMGTKYEWMLGWEEDRIN